MSVCKLLRRLCRKHGRHSRSLLYTFIGLTAGCALLMTGVGIFILMKCGDGVLISMEPHQPQPLPSSLIEYPTTTARVCSNNTRSKSRELTFLLRNIISRSRRHRDETTMKMSREDEDETTKDCLDVSIDVQQPSDVNQTDSLNETNDALQRKRTLLVRDVCTKINETSDRSCGIRFDSMIVDERHRVLYCSIPKVASSSVKVAMALMTGMDGVDAFFPVHDAPPMQKIGLYSVDYLGLHRPEVLQSEWNSLRKFFIVRHPFERLVSAYIDKFTKRNKYSDYFQRRYGGRIVRLYRKKTNGTMASREHPYHNVTFSEFVRFLTDDAVPCWMKFNPHWLSYTYLCQPCFIHYNYIIRQEALDDEMAYLWPRLYDEKKVKVDEVLFKRNAGDKRSRDILEKYMTQLSKEEKRRLFKLYESDFKMFDYQND